ncbi:hypothetical protein FPQ18DRAFT_335071 [Pyronema domesticum]|nr:hypothetical protein FPQ18DRAFT_335071 [Pyronema domesticum]
MKITNQPLLFTSFSLAHTISPHVLFVARFAKLSCFVYLLLLGLLALDVRIVSVISIASEACEACEPGRLIERRRSFMSTASLAWWRGMNMMSFVDESGSRAEQINGYGHGQRAQYLAEDNLIFISLTIGWLICYFSILLFLYLLFFFYFFFLFYLPAFFLFCYLAWDIGILLWDIAEGLRDTVELIC